AEGVGGGRLRPCDEPVEPAGSDAEGGPEEGIVHVLARLVLCNTPSAHALAVYLQGRLEAPAFPGYSLQPYPGQVEPSSPSLLRDLLRLPDHGHPGEPLPDDPHRRLEGSRLRSLRQRDVTGRLGGLAVDALPEVHRGRDAGKTTTAPGFWARQTV